MLATLLAFPATAQDRPRSERFGDDNIAVELLADGAPTPGERWMLALRFTPKAPEWHGYWANPGDAGLPMALALDVPEDWTVGEPIYPVPRRLVIAGQMNHVFEGEYTVLVPVDVPQSAARVDIGPITGHVEYLACTDEICVPQDAQVTARLASDGFERLAMQAAPLLDAEGRFEIEGGRLRIALPLPAALTIERPHIFVRNLDLVAYSAEQTFVRRGNRLIADIPLAFAEAGANLGAQDAVSGIIAYGEGEGLRFTARRGPVPTGGEPITAASAAFDGPVSLPFGWALLGALIGGLILNVMPCVFPILSLKAMSLVRAGSNEKTARGDALGYSAGVIATCLALGGALLALRAAGENVGWAFQLQEPAVVVALFILTVALTANFAGVFRFPGVGLAGGPGKRGAFATGALAAFVATPCTGPFMAAALGAALLLPTAQAMLLFGALGLGLALPFLAIGFVPALRRRLPRPGAWMETFRRWMALPMGLTALALAWLLWRLGGLSFLLGMTTIAIVVVLLLAAFLGELRSANTRWAAAGVATFLLIGGAMGFRYEPTLASPPAAASVHDPVPFSQTALAEARASGAPVFVWFTADWCVSCKVNEAAAIEREATRDAFEKAGVVTIRGDWTRRDEAITAFLFERGAAGVPLYLWYPPGGEATPLPQLLTPEILVEAATRGRDISQ